jgi:micrococcal nuclease|tara:strand:- start:4544 stop:4921 length:378 start_codon:yes stop_codon:yes gene_type:complete
MEKLQKYTYDVEVKRVVDGDTVDVIIDLGFNTYIKRRIRMYGINAPESRTRDLEEKAKGLAAKKRLKEYVEENKIVMKSWGKGKYGRILGELFTEKDSELGLIHTNINEALVSEGHAKAYFGGKR